MQPPPPQQQPEQGEAARGKGTTPLAQRLYLSSLPPNIAKALAVYDTNFDGILGENEVALAAADMEHMQNIVEQEKEGKIPLDFFPEPVRKILCEFDANSDGELDVVEIMHGFEALKRERKRRRQLVWVLIGLLIFTVILLGAIGGLMAWIVESSKQTKINDTVMMVKGGEEAVRTSSAEYAVVDGVMMARGDPDQSCTEGQCSQPLKLSQALQTGALSSQVSDKDLEELRQMKIGNEGSWISFQVFAVARYQDADSEFGSIVAIYTHLGEIYLDGSAVSFHESLEGAFSRAGFEVDSGRRRLLGVVELLGLFNLLTDISDSAIGNITQLLSGTPEYTAAVSQLYLCRNPMGDVCQYGNGQWVNHLVSYNDENARLVNEQQVLISIDSKPFSLTAQTLPQFDSQTRYVVREGSRSLTFQKYDNKYYHCTLESIDTALQDVVNGEGRVEGAEASILKTENLGRITLMDKNGDSVLCNHWKLTMSHGDQELFYFETVENPRFFQLNVSNIVRRIDSIDFEAMEFSTLAEAIADSRVPAEIDIDAIWAACDPPGLVAPKKVELEELGNTTFPSAQWGTPSTFSSGKLRRSARRAAPTAADLFNGSPAECAAQNPPCTQTWCIETSQELPVVQALTGTYEKYTACDTRRRNANDGPDQWKLTVSLDDATASNEDGCFAALGGPDDLQWTYPGNPASGPTCNCFSGTGQVNIILYCDPDRQPGQECDIQTSGTMQVNFNTFACLAALAASHTFDAFVASGFNFPNIPSVFNLDTEDNIFTTTTFAEAAVDNNNDACPNAKYGSQVPETIYYVTNDQASSNQPTVTYKACAADGAGITAGPASMNPNSNLCAGEDLEMRFDMDLSLKVLVVPLPTCSDNQGSGGNHPHSNKAVGFKVDLDQVGKAYYYTGSAQNSPTVFDMSAKRVIYPPQDGTKWCHTGNNIHRFKMDGTNVGVWAKELGLLECNSPCEVIAR